MKLKTFLAAGSAALALAFSGPASAQEATATDTMPADATPGPALWKLADEDTTIYLFGTVHLLPESANWFDARIADALTSSDELVLEIDLDDPARLQQVMMAEGTLQADGTLRDLMQPEDRGEYETALAGFGLPPAAFDRFEPWMAAMTLSVLPLMTAGYNPASGVENQLKVHAPDKPRGSLETVESQIALFDTLPMDKQLTFLDETVEALPEVAGTLDKMVARWLEGDAVTLAALMNEEMDDPELYDLLLANRNANWAEWINARMDRPGTVFVAVGAGHLAGRDSVQQLLEERGLEVTRLWH